MKTDGDLRMLGAMDGFAHSLVWVNGHIGRINGPYSPRIHPRHVRKLAEREKILRPLREMQERLRKSHDDVSIAYENSRKEIA